MPLPPPPPLPLLRDAGGAMDLGLGGVSGTSAKIIRGEGEGEGGGGEKGRLTRLIS